jgi:chitinase
MILRRILNALALSAVIATSNAAPGAPWPGPEAAAAVSPRVVGYYTEWAAAGTGYLVRDVERSGAAGRLTHLLYAFGEVSDGRCRIADEEAAHGRRYGANESVDGVADPDRADALRGNFGQLRRLKRMHPELKVIWSFGGWTGSAGFGAAAAAPAAFADSCYRLLADPRWAGLFDGIDIDWEYPNACGAVCDHSGRDGYRNLMAALRHRFGARWAVTSAITADAAPGGKLDVADYVGAAPYVDWFMPMTYDYAGAWDSRTAPHSPLTAYRGIPATGQYTAATIAKLTASGIPPRKLLLGLGFYGRGWTGVTDGAPGGTSTGPAPGDEPGVATYRVLTERCPVTGLAGGTAVAHCGQEWWSYDTPSTIAGKLAYARRQHLGGAFFWELSGDTADGELIRAVHRGLHPRAEPDP